MRTTRPYQKSEPLSPVCLLLLGALSCSVCAADRGNDVVQGFPTPGHVVAAYHAAIGKKDWRTCFSCYDPEMRGDHLQRMFFATAVTQNPQLAGVVNKHLRVKSIDDIDAVLRPAIKVIDGHPVLDNRLVYDSLNKRIGDVPAFVEEYCRQLDRMGQTPFMRIDDVKDIQVRGNRAVGSWTRPAPVYIAPTLEEPPRQRNDVVELPPLPPMPIHFSRIDGSWYFAHPPETRRSPRQLPGKRPRASSTLW